MRVAVAIVAIFCARFLMEAWWYPLHDGDIGWQHLLGLYVLAHHHLPQRLGNETFTAPGASWVPQEWAFSVAVAWLIEHGRFAILAIASVLAAGLSILSVAYRSRRRGASAFAIALVTTCTGFALMESFGVRAQIFGWLFLSVVLTLLDLENGWLFLALIAVALWANVHASALIAPVIIGAWALGTWIEDRAWTPRVERNAVLAAASLVVVCFTPLLWHLPVYALTLETSVIRSAISEWQPTDLLFDSFALGLLPLLSICVYFGVAAPRERWRDGMLFAVAALAMGVAVRHVPIAALIIAPMAAQRLSSLVSEHVRVNVLLRERFSQVLIYTCSAIVFAVILLDLSTAPRIRNLTLPKKALVALSRLPGTHNLYCEDFAWCSVALEQPNLRVFLDGRADPYPAPVWKDYLAVERATPDWDSVLRRWNVDSVLVNNTKALAQAIRLREGEWRLYYRDKKYEVFLRRGMSVSDSHTSAPLQRSQTAER
jgi:hypothetical protein